MSLLSQSRVRSYTPYFILHNSLYSEVAVSPLSAEPGSPIKIQKLTADYPDLGVVLPQPPAIPLSSPRLNLAQQHVLTVSAFDKEALHLLFNIAHSFRVAVQKERTLDHVCRGKVSSASSLAIKAKTVSFIAEICKNDHQTHYLTQASQDRRTVKLCVAGSQDCTDRGIASVIIGYYLNL